MAEVPFQSLPPGDRREALRAAQEASGRRTFFREKDAQGQWIDYGAAVSGERRLVPDGFARNALERDYERMISGGMLLDDAEPFDRLIERCAAIEARANDT